MNKTTANKTVLITGAADGIGLALSQVSLDNGYQVMMTDVNLEKLSLETERLSRLYPDRVFSMPCDVTKPHALMELADSYFARFKTLHSLYNNAGIIGKLCPVWETTPEDLQRVLDVNVHGMLNVIRAFMPYLLKQDASSHIVNIGSLFSLCTSSQTAPYALSKHAVLALSESLYFDLSRIEAPIDVSVVFPSFTDTSLLAKNQHGLGHELSNLLSHARPALEVAEHIVRNVEEKRFYISPDREVKGYCEDRIKGVLESQTPVKNSVEQLMAALIKRNNRAETKARANEATLKHLQ